VADDHCADTHRSAGVNGSEIRLKVSAAPLPLAAAVMVVRSSCSRTSPGGRNVAVDSSGSAYVLGGDGSVRIARVNGAGTALVYSTLLGGAPHSSGSWGLAIAVDSVGHAYVTGWTDFEYIPATAGALGHVPWPPEADNFYEYAIVAKLNPSGTVVYSGYVLQGPDTLGTSIAIDELGNAYVGGESMGDGFVVKVNPTATALGPFQSLHVPVTESRGQTAQYVPGRNRLRMEGHVADNTGHRPANVWRRDRGCARAQVECRLGASVCDVSGGFWLRRVNGAGS
jgi:beta-propeller repeat-containing protein